MPDEVRNCFELPNGLGALKNAVLTGAAQKASVRREKETHDTRVALAIAHAVLKKAESSRASAERRGRTTAEKNPDSYVAGT